MRFSVYAPIAGLSADFIFNDPWNPPTQWRALQEGWNELVFDLTPASTDRPAGVASANEFILRVVARFDYIMDGGRRHGIRVIVTLDNYWPDYGGINQAAQWLGLDNKLQFFTDPAGVALYQAVFTLNGEVCTTS